MKRFTNKEDREQAIRELMTAIRKNTQPSKCIDVYENLLHEVKDENVVDNAIVNMLRFIEDFSRLSNGIDRMKQKNTDESDNGEIYCKDFISRMLTTEFINPSRYFNESRKLAKMYLALNDIIKLNYYHYIYDGVQDIILSNKSTIGTLAHKKEFSSKEILEIVNYTGDIYKLSNDEVKEKLELARLVVLLYNYMPAVVKAMVQTKRRALGFDKNSKKFD